MTTGGSAPAAVVAAPVKVCAPAPLMSRVAVPPVVVEAWLIDPWAASVPVPLSAPLVRLSEPVTVSAVPAAIDVVARKSTALRLCEPVIVPPAKTSVELPGSSGSRGVRPAGGCADRAGQGERARGLVDDHHGQVAAGGGRCTGQGLGTAAVDEQGRTAAAIAERLVDRPLRSDRTHPVDRTTGQAQRAADTERRASSDGLRRVERGVVERDQPRRIDRRSTATEGSAPTVRVERPAGDGRGARDSECPGGSGKRATAQAQRSVEGDVRSPTHEGRPSLG